MRYSIGINVLVLCIPVFGLFYFDDDKQRAIDNELLSLTRSAHTLALALGEGAVTIHHDQKPYLVPNRSLTIIKQLEASIDAHIQLFNTKGILMLDSDFVGRNAYKITREPLPHPRQKNLTLWDNAILFIQQRYTLLRAYLFSPSPMPPFEKKKETLLHHAAQGRTSHAIHHEQGHNTRFHITTPVQYYKSVVGMLYLSRDDTHVRRTMQELYQHWGMIFSVAFLISLLSSLSLALYIARPLRTIVAMMRRVQKRESLVVDIPHIGQRKDEIGSLATTLQSMSQTLYKRYGDIESFTADIIHEIKNPLTSLQSALETEKHVKDEKKRKQLFAIMEEDIQRIHRLLTDIGYLSKLDTDLHRSHAQTIDISALISKLIDSYRLSTMMGGCDIVQDTTTDRKEQKPFLVFGIEDFLVHVFRNLFDNALSLTAPSSVIRYRLTREDAMLRIDIDDEGPGLPSVPLTRLFERFYSERRSEKNKKSAHTGLGLNISYNIVRAHHGTLTAENRRDHHHNVIGARFTIRLPAASNKPPPTP